MKAINVQRGSWKTVLKRQGPLLLPAAHDALSACLIERSGFKAYQIGGFALAGSAHAVPDVGLDGFGEKAPLVRQIINASPLPVLVDADDGYGDAKSVTRTIREYEAMGVSAIFIEDQAAPKKCGHMEGKKVIEQKSMARGASDLKNGRPMSPLDGVDMKQFEEILSLQFWAQMEKKFPM